MFGLPEDAILSMLKEGVRETSYEGFAEFIHGQVIPNIAKVIAANNEAILFAMETTILERLGDDQVEEERH